MTKKKHLLHGSVHPGRSKREGESGQRGDVSALPAGIGAIAAQLTIFLKSLFLFLCLL